MSSDLKNVVVVGASIVGATAAKTLATSLPPTHRVVLIERNEVAYWPVGGLRAAVVPGFEEHVFAPIQGIFPPDSRHLVKAGTDVINVTNENVTVRDVDGNEEVIPFEYAILGTGAKYSGPSRALSPKRTEAIAALKTLQEQLKAAQSVLIVGGGEVGVEYAGEVYSQYPDKKITLVSRGKTLVGKGFGEGLSSTLKKQLIAHKVELILGDTVELGDDISSHAGSLVGGPRTFTTQGGTTIENVDFVLVATGNTPQSELFRNFDPDSVTDSGAVKVDPSTLQATSPKLDKWFAAGDVTNGDYVKNAANAKPSAITAANNVVLLIKGSKATKAFKPLPKIAVVPLGPHGGASHFVFFTLGEWVTSAIKGKTLFLSMFRSNYNLK